MPLAVDGNATAAMEAAATQMAQDTSQLAGNMSITVTARGPIVRGHSVKEPFDHTCRSTLDRTYPTVGIAPEPRKGRPWTPGAGRAQTPLSSSSPTPSPLTPRPVLPHGHPARLRTTRPLPRAGGVARTVESCGQSAVPGGRRPEPPEADLRQLGNGVLVHRAEGQAAIRSTQRHSAVQSLTGGQQRRP
jgi:hypothetical protein